MPVFEANAACQIQKLAALGVSDGLVELEPLADLAAKGTRPANAERDLHRRISRDVSWLPPITNVRVRVKHKRRRPGSRPNAKGSCCF